jgi:type I restriction enzyme S subunit
MTTVRTSNGWREVPLSQLCELTELINPEKEPEKPFLYVDVSSVSNETFRITEPRQVLGKDAPSRARKVIRRDDVIFATVRPSLQRVALIPAKLDAQVCSTGFCVLRSKRERLDPLFLYFSLLTERIQRKVEGLQDGATYPAIRDSDLFGQCILLPTVGEQQAIARALDAVQKAKEARQRELALERERKAALIEYLFTEVESAKHEMASSVVELGKLITSGPQNGIYKPMGDYGTGTLIIRIDDFDEEGKLTSSAIQRVRLTAKDVQTYGLIERDLLINRVNSLSHLGKALLVRRFSEPVVFESNMMRLRLDESRVLPEYVWYFLLTETAKSYVRGRAKRAVAQSSINQGDVGSIPVPLPPVSQQNEIVSILGASDGKLQSLERECALLDELFRALLEELMTGRLSAVPLIEDHQTR